MPSKKKKYNARFPAGRIKKIMQTDEEVGKVALAVPIIISRTLELFVESLLKKAMQVTNAKNAKTLSPSHMKQCILSESRFDFLKELVEKIPDVCVTEEVYEPSVANSEKQDPITSSDINKIPKIPNAHSESSSSKRRLSERQSFENNGSQNLNTVVDLSVGNKSIIEPPQTSSGPNFYKELSCPSTIVTSSVIQFSPKIQTTKKLSHSVHSIMNHTPTKVPKLSTSVGSINESTITKPIFHLDLSQTGCNTGAPLPLNDANEDVKDINQVTPVFHLDLTKYDSETPPPLVPITDGHLVHNSSFKMNNTNDDLDEDYDN